MLKLEPDELEEDEEPATADVGDAIGDQTTADPMNRLHRQLFGGLDGHEAHGTGNGCRG